MVFITFQQAIDEKTRLLNEKLVQYDRWASRNPDKLVTCTRIDDPLYIKGEKFRQIKQELKVLRLELQVLQENMIRHQNTPL